MLVERDRLMILVIVGRTDGSDEHCFRREVGIGSKSQLVSGESDSSLEISFIATGAKIEKYGGVTGGGL